MLPEEKKNTEAWPVIQDFAKATAKYPWLFFGVVIGILSATATNLAAPLFLKHFIDLLTTAGIDGTLRGAMLATLGGYAVITFLNWAAYRIQMMSVIRLEARVEQDLLNRAFGYLIGHGHDFFIDNFTGSLTRRVGRYAHSYQQIFNSLIEGMMPTLLFAVGVIVVLFLQNWWIGLGLLIWTIFFLILQYVMTKWRYQFKLERSAADSRLTGALSDVIGNHSTVAYFATQNAERRLISGVIGDWYRATMKSWNSDVVNYGVQGFLTRAAQIGLLFGSFFLWSEGLLSLGTLVLIQIYILSLMDQIMNIGSNMRQLYDAFAEGNEMIGILAQPHSIRDADSASTLTVAEGAITLDSVDFSFDDLRPILSGFNLTVASGEKVALVGPSGAGKSTITKLLLRLYDVTGGSVQIDGTDIRTVTQESLRRAISFVPQESVLFHRSLRENITYGKEGATEEEIVAAAKKAHCHDFIASLPNGYDTLVGERGIKLSGGERQRVAIARAILKDAPILVLDEATSSLDSESEALIQDALKVLMEGKTVIVIAHRLSTIMKMDRIIVIEDGQIAAEGTHEELLNHEGGLYHKLWSIQAGSFLTDTRPA
ncbi:MAG: ATP-binding cassette, subfamily B, bacterial [Parcubacteria bacterium C7867-004]|nr:MAG: ATP-binding cassette, subfamily B, bacterial [Parcubacteria bacterium C7867-004]